MYPSETPPLMFSLFRLDFHLYRRQAIGPGGQDDLTRLAGAAHNRQQVTLVGFAVVSNVHLFRDRVA